MVCRQAGFNSGSSIDVAKSDVDTPILVRAVSCKGSEASLEECASTLLDTVPEECNTEVVAGVECTKDTLLGWWPEAEFLTKDLGFTMQPAALPRSAAPVRLSTIHTPAGPVTPSLSLRSGALPAQFQFPDGSNRLVQLQQADASSEWLSLYFPAGTKAFGLYLAPDACALDKETSVVFELEAEVGLRGQKYTWSQDGSMPACNSKTKADVGGFVGLYTADAAWDSITELRIRVPKYDNGKPVPVLLGGLEISNTIPTASSAAAAPEQAPAAAAGANAGNVVAASRHLLRSSVRPIMMA